MSILDNEGHDPLGFGNTRASTREVLCACTDACAMKAEIERLRAALKPFVEKHQAKREFYREHRGGEAAVKHFDTMPDEWPADPTHASGVLTMGHFRAAERAYQQGQNKE